MVVCQKEAVQRGMIGLICEVRGAQRDNEGLNFQLFIEKRRHSDGQQGGGGTMAALC